MYSNICVYIYIYIYIYISNYDIITFGVVQLGLAAGRFDEAAPSARYGQFSEFQTCFCGLDPGYLKFETVRSHRQRICF